MIATYIMIYNCTKFPGPNHSLHHTEMSIESFLSKKACERHAKNYKQNLQTIKTADGEMIEAKFAECHAVCLQEEP